MGMSRTRLNNGIPSSVPHQASRRNRHNNNYPKILTPSSRHNSNNNPDNPSNLNMCPQVPTDPEFVIDDEPRLPANTQQQQQQQQQSQHQQQQSHQLERQQPQHQLLRLKLLLLPLT